MSYYLDYHFLTTSLFLTILSFTTLLHFSHFLYLYSRFSKRSKILWLTNEYIHRAKRVKMLNKRLSKERKTTSLSKSGECQIVDENNERTTSSDSENSSERTASTDIIYNIGDAQPPIETIQTSIQEEQVEKGNRGFEVANFEIEQQRQIQANKNLRDEHATLSATNKISET